MKLAIMQPYFFPYIGYWQLINAVDTFVIYDDVNYIKQGWINRNRILVNQQEHMLTLPLMKISSNKLINEIELSGGRERLVKTVSMAYRKAPFFNVAMPVIEKILLQDTNNLALFLESSIRQICSYIGLKKQIIVSSTIEKDNTLKAQEKIFSICEKLKADMYVNATGGSGLYDAFEFKRRGIDLAFIQSLPFEYTQLGKTFTPGLSMIDVLMFNSHKQLQEQLNQYKLVKP